MLFNRVLNHLLRVALAREQAVHDLLRLVLRAREHGHVVARGGPRRAKVDPHPPGAADEGDGGQLLGRAPRAGRRAAGHLLTRG